MLKASPGASNRQIAQQANADHKTVGKVRQEQEATGEVPQLNKTTGADGKARTTTPRKPKKVNRSKHAAVKDIGADYMDPASASNAQNAAAIAVGRCRELTVRLRGLHPGYVVGGLNAARRDADLIVVHEAAAFLVAVLNVAAAAKGD
jgi:hypothetical protein